MNQEQLQLFLINLVPQKKWMDMRVNKSFIRGVDNAPNFFEGCKE